MPQEQLPAGDQNTGDSFRPSDAMFSLSFCFLDEVDSNLLYLSPSYCLKRQWQMVNSPLATMAFQYPGIHTGIFMNELSSQRTHSILRLPKFQSSLETTAKLPFFFPTRRKQRSVWRCDLYVIFLLASYVWVMSFDPGGNTVLLVSACSMSSSSLFCPVKLQVFQQWKSWVVSQVLEKKSDLISEGKTIG